MTRFHGPKGTLAPANPACITFRSDLPGGPEVAQRGFGPVRCNVVVADCQRASRRVRRALFGAEMGQEVRRIAGLGPRGPQLHWASRIGQAIVLVAGLVGCTGQSDALISHRGLNGGPAALLEATLTRVGTCIYGENNDGEWLLVWPSGFRIQGDDIKNGSGSTVAAMGRKARLGGGEYHDSQYGFLRTLLNADVPSECRSKEYWLVTSVT
jgi:hypothetical protein